jgi:hypothetical protein
MLTLESRGIIMQQYQKKAKAPYCITIHSKYFGDYYCSIDRYGYPS